MTRNKEWWKRRIIGRARRLIARLDGIIADVDWWNRAHPDEQPLDCEGDRVFKAKIAKDLAEFIARNGDIE